MSIRIGITLRTTTSTTPTGTPTAGAIVGSAEGRVRVELFAANFLMKGGLFLMPGRVLGSEMRLMVRMSVNFEELESHFIICIYH